MTYYVVKRIGKYEYLYEQTSYREGGKVKSKCRSLGPWRIIEKILNFIANAGPYRLTPDDRAEDMVLDKIAKDREAAATAKAEEEAKAEQAKADQTKAEAKDAAPAAPSAPDTAPSDAGQPDGQSGNDGDGSTS